MKCPACKFEFKDPARVKGGENSRRTMTRKQAQKAARARWGKKKETK